MFVLWTASPQQRVEVPVLAGGVKDEGLAREERDASEHPPH